MRDSRQTKPTSYFKANAEAFALLEILALGNQQVARGKVKPVAEVVKRLRAQSMGD